MSVSHFALSSSPGPDSTLQSTREPLCLCSPQPYLGVRFWHRKDLFLSVLYFLWEKWGLRKLVMLWTDDLGKGGCSSVCRVLADLRKTLGSVPSATQSSVVTRASDSNIWQVEAGRWRLQGQPRLYSQFKARLCYIRPCLNLGYLSLYNCMYIIKWNIHIMFVICTYPHTPHHTYYLVVRNLKNGYASFIYKALI